ncbi:MAG TPA: hypothetical protein VFK04_22120 [Gemmatimonadaceae bacterium]|jgi:hypothetical protein|nr:hypothetical protein [Gemmatimonadaceae bacterium]
MGCLRSIGCLVLVVVIAVAAWWFRADWLPLLHRGTTANAADSASAVVWEPATPEGAARAKEAVAKLGTRSGPVFTNLPPGDLTAYILSELSKQLPPSAHDVEAAVFDRELWVRAQVRLSDFGGPGELGPLGGFFGEAEPVMFGGTLAIVNPGLAVYRVKELRIRDMSVPSPMISKLLRRVEHGSRPPGLADDALPMLVPDYIADVRIQNGKITLYKTVQ